MTTSIQLSNVTFHRGDVGDAAELATFAARTFKETYAASNRPEDMAAHIAGSYGLTQQTAELADERTATLLARASGELVAYAQVTRNPAPPCVTQQAPIELCRFYVDRRAHGSGLALSLMQEVFQVVRALDGHCVWLGVWEQNPRAIAFYKKAGFNDVGSTIFMVGPDKQTDRVLVCVVPTQP